VEPVLYHFSEDPSIARFIPRGATYDPASEPLVWGIDADHAPLYFFPRDCPRVCFRPSSGSSPEDIERFLALTTASRVIVVEGGWIDRIRRTTLYRYLLPSSGFVLRDAGAGYYVSADPVEPLGVEGVGDLIDAIVGEDIELRVTPKLWPIHDAVAGSTLEYSMIRMRNALPR
jgi:hypothetical protein